MTDLEYRVAVRALDRCPRCVKGNLPPNHPWGVTVRADDAAASYLCRVHSYAWITHWSVAALGISP